MGYLHINNLYKDQTVLMFQELYALEKIHGTSAHIAWTPLAPEAAAEEVNAHTDRVVGHEDHAMLVVKDKQEQDYFFPDPNVHHGWLPGKLTIFSGGASVNLFEGMLNLKQIAEWCAPINQPIAIHGELYGGSQQKQSWRYGSSLKFVAFDVHINQSWLSVPDAEDVVKKLGLEFVSYTRIKANLAEIDAARDAPSVQAKRNGVEGDVPMEGVVLRPIVEAATNHGRIIVKHKRDEERETKTPRKVEDPNKLQRIAGAKEIAEEWVTETRLDHVLDKLPPGIGIDKTGVVIAAMTEDVIREAGLEIVDSKESRNAIAAKARELFHARVKKVPSVQNQ